MKRRAFSLVELLLAIFILGIGVVAVAALFPAGIAQQLRSADDVIGPIVANNALSVIRAKLEPEDFGRGGASTGDWTWSRPAFYVTGAVLPYAIEAGSISVFNDQVPGTTDGEVPWNLARYGPAAPLVVITQRERFYPMQSSQVGGGPPQYVWECMFRRFQGRVLVAIFVYRVSLPAGRAIEYAVPPNVSNPSVPPLPVALSFASPAAAWDAAAVVTGAPAGTPYDPGDQAQSWQEPRQWILDQNNNVHRVLSWTRGSPGDPARVEFTRPIPEIMSGVVPPYSVLGPVAPGQKVISADVVTSIWYIPVEMRLASGDTVRLTPAYVTVREL